jgi:hypothetical protein
MTIACAAQQQYNIPAGGTQSNFLWDREQCANISGYKGGGGFLFGPLIIIAPIIGILGIIQG